MSRKRTLYLSELLKKCQMLKANVHLMDSKTKLGLWYNSVLEAMQELANDERWNKQVKSWYVVKAIEYVIAIIY